MAELQNPGWRAMASRGFADLSPPEAQHAMLELPTNRADYVGVLQDLGDYPARSPIGPRVPSDSDVEALKRGGGPWRGVVLLEDERTARHAAVLFDRVFVLDPFYDSGAQLYAAWHDPIIKDEHSRRLAEQAGWLVRLAPLFNAGTAVLAPDHLPGSWNPRPGWRKPRAPTDRRQLAAWAMRSGLVLLYWADRLDAVACTARSEVIAAIEVALGAQARAANVELRELASSEEAQRARDEHAIDLCDQWQAMRRASRRRPRGCMEDVAYVMSGLALGDTGSDLAPGGTRPDLAPAGGARSDLTPGGTHSDLAPVGKRATWRLAMGPPSVPEPTMLIRRVLNGQDPEREPALPRRPLKRRPLCLLGGD